MQLSRINLILGGLVALLGLFAVFTLIPRNDSSVHRLTEMAPQALHFIRIDRGNGDVIAFENSLNGWRMTLPHRQSVNTDKVQAVARIAQARSRRRFPSSETDPAELGLSPPQVQLQLDHELFEFGGTEPIRRRRYVRVGEWVHLIDDLFQHHLLATPEAFVHSPQSEMGAN